MSGKILGIDLGEARTGVAISDDLHMLASPLTVVKEKDSKKIIEQIIKIIEENKVDKIVVGLPKNMDGSLGSRGQLCKKIAEEIKLKSSINLILWDERLTTVSAKKMLNEQNIRDKARKAKIDMYAACIILQSYLDSI